MKRKATGKILSLALAFTLVLTLIGVRTFAEEGQSIGTSNIITAFEALPEGVAVQHVPLGMSLGGLALPDSLNATIDSGSGTIPGIAWQSAPVYNPDTAGTYIFTPKIPATYTVAVGVEAPKISVTVAAPGCM